MIVVFMPARDDKQQDEIAKVGILPSGSTRDLIRERENEKDTEPFFYENEENFEAVTTNSIFDFRQSRINPNELPKRKTYSYFAATQAMNNKVGVYGYPEGEPGESIWAYTPRPLSERAVFNVAYPQSYRDKLQRVQTRYIEMGVVRKEDKVIFDTVRKIMDFRNFVYENNPEFLTNHYDIFIAPQQEAELEKILESQQEESLPHTTSTTTNNQ